MYPPAQKPGRWRQRLKGLAALFAIGILLWLGGLIAFAARIAAPAQTPGPADGIVVLTGGTERLEFAVRLLLDGKASRLLLSGVGPETSKDDLRRLVAEPLAQAGEAGETLFDCCVDIDRRALDTVGNAEETARWVSDRGLRSLIIVTANYHMPRSLIELRRTLPDTQLIAQPVFPGRVDVQRWWLKPGTFRLVVSEYGKYLVSLLRARLDGWGGWQV